MTASLDGKVALVTGAGGSIGRAAALLFAENGARVVAVDSSGNEGASTSESIRHAGGDSLSVAADVSSASDVEKMTGAVRAAYGRLDVLFNVAGISGRSRGDGPAAECTEEAWDLVLRVNLKSVFLCCKFAIPLMLESGGGSIVNLSSVLGMVGGDEDFATHAYAASKGGIISLTKGIASFYAPQKIRANVICPGLIATGMSRRAQESEHIRRRLSDLQPLTGDFGSPDDVAEAALYLASDRSSFVTGAVLTVDGGWTVR